MHDGEAELFLGAAVVGGQDGQPGRHDRLLGVLLLHLRRIPAVARARVRPRVPLHLVDLVLDKAGQKGTGKWTSQIALDLGIPIPTIDAAIVARTLSSFKSERVEASKELNGPTGFKYEGDKREMIDAIHDALYASKICSYAQGMNLIREGSKNWNWDINLGEVSRIWKGGCIIRAQFLDRIKQAYQRRPDLPNLLLDQDFKAFSLRSVS